MKLSKFLRAAIAATTLLVGIVHTAKADIVTYTGDTTGGPTWNRPVESLTDLSAVGTDVAYQTLTLQASVDGAYSFLSSAGFDQLIFLYANAFDAANPLANGVIGNDDLINTSTSGFEAELLAGVTYYFVTTAFSNGDAGAYSVTIAGPGLVSAVPEPSAWLMLAMGLAAVTYAQRRKSQR